MSVYVDEPRESHARLGIGPPRWKYKQHAHLIADSWIELDDFACKLQLRRDWRHGDHYDVTPRKRLEAIRLGAIQVDSRFVVKLRKRLARENLRS
jgi:hypothetical protein